MKKIIHLTLSVIVITGMLFSVSGTKFHFHYCGTTGEMYADIHLISDNNYEHTNCSVKNKCNFCSDHSDKQSSCAETDLSQCCYDVNTRIITETEYEGKQHHRKIVLSGIILRHTSVPENASHYISLLKAPDDFGPPDLVSSIVLLI